MERSTFTWGLLAILQKRHPNESFESYVVDGEGALSRLMWINMDGLVIVIPQPSSSRSAVSKTKFNRRLKRILSSVTIAVQYLSSKTFSLTHTDQPTKAHLRIRIERRLLLFRDTLDAQRHLPNIKITELLYVCRHMVQCEYFLWLFCINFLFKNWVAYMIMHMPTGVDACSLCVFCGLLFCPSLQLLLRITAPAPRIRIIITAQHRGTLCVTPSCN